MNTKMSPTTQYFQSFQPQAPAQQPQAFRPSYTTPPSYTPYTPAPAPVPGPAQQFYAAQQPVQQYHPPQTLAQQIPYYQPAQQQAIRVPVVTAPQQQPMMQMNPYASHVITLAQPTQTVGWYGAVPDPMTHILGASAPPFRPQVQGETFMARVLKNVLLAAGEAVLDQAKLGLRQVMWLPEIPPVDINQPR